MANKAIIPSDQDLERILDELMATVKRPLVERVVFLLSYKAGLRAQEIAGLTWQDNILDDYGNIGTQEYTVPGSKGRMKKVRLPIITVTKEIAKYGSARTFRMHDMLFEALTELRAAGYDGDYVIPSGKRGANQDLKARAHALVVRVKRYYERLGLSYTSHTGRRKFITDAAQRANYANAHLGDVQVIAGHKHLSSTQVYLVGTPQQADIIGLL